LFKLEAKTRKKEKKQEKDNGDDDELVVMFYNEYSGDCRSCPFYGLCGG